MPKVQKIAQYGHTGSRVGFNLKIYNSDFERGAKDAALKTFDHERLNLQFLELAVLQTYGIVQFTKFLLIRLRI